MSDTRKRWLDYVRSSGHWKVDRGEWAGDFGKVRVRTGGVQTSPNKGLLGLAQSALQSWARTCWKSKTHVCQSHLQLGFWPRIGFCQLQEGRQKWGGRHLAFLFFPTVLGAAGLPQRNGCCLQPPGGGEAVAETEQLWWLLDSSLLVSGLRLWECVWNPYLQ